MAQEKERPAGSQSLFRGLMLIEILSNYPNGCPLAHLSELAGLNKSTVHRLLQGLQSCGYVTTAPAAGSYRLTTKFIAVGQKALSSLNIIHIAAPLSRMCASSSNIAGSSVMVLRVNGWISC
ncbi:IclR family transcriptional regulator [Escherichia coli]